MQNDMTLPDASLLSELAARARKKAGRQEIEQLYPDRSLFLACLKSPVPKVRKNAARLLGALQHPEDSVPLGEALLQETVLYVIPSLILALGATQGEAAKSVLTSYVMPKACCPDDQVHLEEISAALTRARSFYNSAPSLPVFHLSKETSCLLRSPDGFSEILCQELSESGFQPIPCSQGAILQISELDPLCSVRCMRELLIPIASKLPVQADVIAQHASPWIGLPYRIELRKYNGNRTSLIRQIASKIAEENNPSHYSIELRIECTGNSCSLYIKPWNLPDHRFSYRKEVLPASIAPETAACLARMALCASSESCPEILDPFCGSATLLIECFRKNPHCHLTGVDRSPAAIRAAKTNASSANVSIHLLQKDFRAFQPYKKADIVISNLPFGNRVGSHKENQILYESFCRMLPGFLSEHGIALLYTADARLFHQCLASNKSLQIVDMLRTNAGGLLPWVFLIRKCSL